MKLSLSSGPSLRFLVGLGLAFTCALRAQDSASGGPLNQQQLDQLLGPIALYPDALVALILPASTVPTDVVLAARYLNSGGDPEQADYQPWNDSLRSLARYPVLVKWMDENLTWTQQMGSAFLNQPDDVMDSVQRLRVRARATGALKSTAQQKLVLDGDVIEIVPAQPDVIYVPYYDPNLVYVEQSGYYDGPYLTFGLGLPIGFWLSYDFNWRSHVVLVGDRHHNWQEHRDWDHHASGNSNSANWHRWQPPANRPPYAHPETHRPHPDVVAPRPLPGAPPRPHDARSDDRGPRPDTHAREPDHNRPPTPVTNNPAARPDAREDRNNRPSAPPPAARPEIKLPPTNVPHPPERDHSVPPAATRQERPNAPVPARQPPARPEHRDAPPPARESPTRPESRPVPVNVPPARVVNPPVRPASPPPPPATNTKDGARDKDSEAQR